jgi:CheY-like chemotaxis protein
VWIRKPEADVPALPDAPSRTRRRRGVLVVDDDRLLRWSLRQILRPDYRVWIADCAEKALDLVARLERLDAVLTDVRLPRMDGVEFLRKVREVRPDLKVFLMTAYDLERGPRKAFSVRADGYLSKPFELDTCRDMLASHLSGPPGS